VCYCTTHDDNKLFGANENVTNESETDYNQSASFFRPPMPMEFFDTLEGIIQELQEDGYRQNIFFGQDLLEVAEVECNSELKKASIR